MPTTNQRPHRAKVGDVLVVSGHRVGEAERFGEIVEVIAHDGGERYRVRWDDDHESLFYPGSDTSITHTVRAGGRKR